MNDTATTTNSTFNPQASGEIGQLQARVASLESELGAARTALGESDRARRVQSALIQHHAFDLDTAQVLVERLIAGQDPPRIEEAVRELRRKKPYLFRAGAATPSMGAHPTAEPPDNLSTLAGHAARTGDRRSVMGYLRARRNH
ncbi:MAG: hypothetical protein KF745_14850 [Phycisphaeraceae bacterium]|nr:hypothetical protein [Phycisphaeraceae bacterium]